MKPASLTEQLMFNTVRIEANDSSSGTGFFFNFSEGDYTIPVLITNKHVVNNNRNETVKFLLHLNEGDGSTKENFAITLQTEWYFHSGKDLCFTFMNPIFEEVKKRTGKQVFYIANEESLIPSKEKLMELSALEEIVMIGYPIGLWDSKNNYPIFRKGYTASHPAYDFNENGIALADIAAFPGSSGSPIYILNENGYSDKKGTTYLGAKRIIFLGILFAGPTMNANGEVSIIDIPTQQKVISRTSIMTNLGYYVKSEELLEFKNLIRAKLDKQSNN
ncbi:S1 family peptidase [Erysipelothrix anatis]|uniref:S1 family peptidase n=1 Tax=Erysipelothrix anatis TaxID=2683713 RepID=UPI001359E514|nr:serine protease [Erysipelothrix anatis]